MKKTGGTELKEKRVAVMNKTMNYQQMLDEIINKNQREGRVKTLLLHSCCGPCSSYVVTYLKPFFDITVFFYNPNIFPEEEYRHRLAEQARLLKQLEIPMIEQGYDHREFLEKTAGFENEPEGGVRCEKCFELRLRKTWELAKERGFDYFATTLTVSPHKNPVVINTVGERISGSGSCRPVAGEASARDDGSISGNYRPVAGEAPERADGLASENYRVVAGEASARDDGPISGNCRLMAEEASARDDGPGSENYRSGLGEPSTRGNDSDSGRLKTNVLWLPSDFKKRDGYKKSIELSKQYQLYRQEYCGCEFALNRALPLTDNEF